MKSCKTCSTYDTCREVCSYVEGMLEEELGREDWRLTYVADPKACMDLQDENVYQVKLLDEKSELRALRPLFGLDGRLRLLYVGWHYFGMSAEELGSILKLKRSRVYGLLRSAKDSMGCVPAGKAVHQSGGDTGPGCGEQEDDLPTV